MARILRNTTSRKNLRPCPFCGGTPEFVSIPGDDIIMRCSSCHASTEKCFWQYEHAVKAWNKGRIVNDNFSLTEDIKIDEYLSQGTKKVLFFQYEEPPYYGNEFMAREIVIVAENIMLHIEAPDNDYLSYEEITGYGAYVDALEIGEEKIEFLESNWNEDKLISLKFKTSNSTFSISCAFDNGWISVIKK